MDRTENVELCNLCMVYDNDGRILVLNRKKPGWTGITFPGGHVEPGESFTDSAIREIKEETGLDVESINLCGVQQFTTGDYSRYIVFYYKTNNFSGTLKNSSEGDVMWVERSRLDELTLASNFKNMLKVFESDDINELQFLIDGDIWTPRYI